MATVAAAPNCAILKIKKAHTNKKVQELTRTKTANKKKIDKLEKKVEELEEVCLFVSHRTILLLAVASNLLTHKILLRLFQMESWIPLHLGGMRLWIASRKVAVHFQTAEVDRRYTSWHLVYVT